MSTERLRTKVVSYGYDEDIVWSWEREELLTRYAGVMLEGAKAKAGPVMVDPEVEKARLAFEWERFEFEKLEKEKQLELEKQKAEMMEKQLEFERQKAENEKAEKERQFELEKQQLDFERQKAEELESF